MKGHGRGYYGDAQLDRHPPKRSWFKIAVVAGLGVAIWWLWPVVSPKGNVETTSPPPPSPLPSIPPPSPIEIEQLAHSRGFPSIKSFEDSVVANLRELRASGATVTLDPRLRYLEARI